MNATRYLLAFALLLAVVSADSKFPIVDYSSSPWVVTLTDTYYDQAAMTTLFEYTITPRTGVPAADLSHWTINPFCPQAELVNKDEWSYGLDTHTDMTGYRSQFGHESTASATVFVLEFEGMVPITDGIVFAVKGNGEYAKSTIRGPNCAVSSVVYPQVPAPDDTSDIYCTDSRVSGPALPPDTTEPPRTYTFVGDETTSERCQHYKNVDRTIQVTDGELVTRYTYQANLRDEIGPDFVSVAGDSPNECAGDRAFILANLPDNHTTTANDQCSGDVDDEHMELCEEIRFDDECPVKILITRTWTAQDDCGNSKCHTQTISYDDTKAPILSNKPGDVEVECPTNWTNAAQVAQYQAAIQQPVITASDDCMTTKPKVNLTKKRIDGECKNTWTLQRTWTVEDECGNSDDHTQYLTVFDETPPVWETNGLPTTVNKQCDEDLSPVWDVTAVDGCSGQTYDTPYTESESGSNPEKCPQDRTIKFTYTTCDDCGNTADDLIRFIKVGDDSPPTWNEDVPAIFGSNLNSDPSLEVYQLDDVSCDDIPTRPQFTANDTCDTATVTSPFDTDDAGPRCTNDRVIIWHYKACDSCDNCIERYIHVNVVDNIDPVIDMTTVPDDDFNVECKTLTPLENINVQTLDDGTSCIEKDDATVTPSQSPRFDEMCLYNYTVTRTWTAQDNCGNTDPVTRTFVVRDNNPPDIIGVPPHTSAYCNAPPASTDVYATDGCSDSTYLDSQLVMTPTGTRPTSGCINYTQTYTWDVQDHCEHKDSDHQDIEVYDNVDPYFIEELFPKDVSVRCDKFADVSTAKPPAGDGCAGVLSVSDHTDTVVAGPAATCKYNRTIERSWTVTDECLNTFTREQTITVFDNKKPDLIGVPENDRVPCHAVPCPPAVTAEDNCNDVKISFKEERVDNVDPDCVDTYTLLRTWTATDACGLEFSKTQVLEVFDEEDPWFFTEPENITELCTGTPPLPDIMTDQGRDLCDKNVEVTGPAVDPSETCHGNKTILYTWTAHDNCGGTKDYVQRITIYDNVGPYWRPAELDDETAECGVDIVPEWPNVGDECTNQDIDYVKDDPDHLDITEVPGSRTCVGNYSLDYTWTATDHCGNPSSITQRFNVYDTKKPIFTNCPGDVIVDCSEIPDVPPVNATDPHSCDNDVDVTYLGETPSTPDSECAHSYTLTREWLAEDDCGHTEMCTQVITVEDQHDPEILGVPETDDNVKCDDVPPPPPVCVHDNCNGVDMWFAESKDTECTGTYNLTRTWTAEDTCGRPAEVKSYVVHVVDDIDPEWNDDLEPPASREYECGDYTEPPKPEGTDTCGGASSVETGRTGENDVLDPNNFPNCNERDITLTWTLTDDCSNSVPRSHVLNVRDNRQPSINFIPALQAEVTDTCTVPTPPTPSSATDDCGISNTPQRTHSDDTTSCPYIFNRTYSWNVNDDCGLAAPTKTQKLIMEDPGLPSWDNEADNNEEDWYVCDTIVPDDTPTATDACGANITPINGPNTLGGFDANASGCRQNFTETRRWTATDVCANDLTWNQILHFYDVVAPTFDARDEPLQPLHNQCSQQNVPDLNSTDNCQTARTTVVALSHEQTNVLCPYRYTVEHKYEAEDECSNTRQTTEPQVYTWDAEPSITVGGVSIDQLPAFQSKTVQCDSIPDLPDTVGQDACGVTLTVTDTDYVPVNADECNYELKRTWSVEDACGVPWSHTQTLTVVDSIAPALHGVPLSTTAECGFVPPAANVTATDSCPGVKLVMTEHRVGWTPENCCDYTLVRTWTATDKCSGLETVESQDIIVSDTNPPEIHNVPEDVTLECLDDGVPGWPTDPEVTAEEAPLGRGHCIDEDIASSSCTPAGTSPPNTATIDGAAFYFTNDAHVITWINGVAFIAGDLTDGTTTYSVNFQLSGKVLANSTSVTDAANLGLNDDCYVANNGDAPVNPNDWKAYTILQGNLTDSSETVHDATMTSEVALIGTGANNYNDGPGARIEFTFDGKAGAFVLQLSDDCDGAWRLYPTLACGPEVTLETDEEIIAYHGCDGRYDILRTWTATDRSDEVTTLTQLIRMRDRVGPKWVQATVPPLNSPATQAEYGCEYPQPGDPQLYDECSNSTEMRTGPTQSPVGETCAHRGSRTYTWGGKDDCNNTAEPVSQTLHRWDGLAPTPTVVPPFVEGSTVERQCTLPPLPSVSWKDNCASPLAVETHNDGDLNPTNTNSCPYHFDVTRSWTAEDVCGNDRTIEYDIEVRDTNPPIKPANPPTSYKVECTSHGFYPADDNDMVFTDECSGVLAPVSHSDTDNRGDPGTCEGGYEVTRTWTATDECNLSTPHTITVTVEDLAKPWINVDHLTAPCDDIPTPEETRVNVTFGDSCDPNPTLVWVEDEDSREPDSCAYDYKILRTWKVTDDCGKENTAVQEITIYDDEAPVLSPRPQNTRMPCDDVQCPELVKANDNCKGVYIAFKEERDDSFGCANEYLLTRTWTATDLCSGKKDEVVQTIEVYDEENPRFTTDPLPQSQIGYECRDVNIDIMPNVEGEDDCGFDQVYTADPHTPPACENFTFIRTWNATDLCGLHVVHTQEVTVKDTGKPYFLDEPAAWYDQLYECAPEATNDPNANDACGSASVTGPTDSPKDNEFCKYNYTFVRTWTATDNCLHTETETQNVRVHDPTAPYEVNPLPVHTVKCDELVAPTVPTYGVHFDDNCSKDAGEFTVTPQFTHNGDVDDGNRENSDPDCPHDYVLRRPWVITDACGHKLHIEEVMSVYDAYDPVLDFKPTEDFAQCHQLWDQQTIGASDTCTESLTVVPDAVNVTNSPAGVPECPGNYDLLRSWYVEDCSGRSDSHNQPIAVRDTLKPWWVESTKPQSRTATCKENVPYQEPMALDECDPDVDVNYEGASFAQHPNYLGLQACFDNRHSFIETRKWNANDDCQNGPIYHTQTITVVDDERPTIIPPADFEDELTVECGEVPDKPEMDIDDNCDDDITIVFNQTNSTTGDCPNERTIIRRWNAKDDCGNEAIEITQIIHVVDTTPPNVDEFSVPPPGRFRCNDLPGEDDFIIETEPPGDCEGQLLPAVGNGDNTCEATSVHGIFFANGFSSNATQRGPLGELVFTASTVYQVYSTDQEDQKLVFRGEAVGVDDASIRFDFSATFSGHVPAGELPCHGDYADVVPDSGAVFACPQYSAGFGSMQSPYRELAASCYDGSSGYPTARWEYYAHYDEVEMKGVPGTPFEHVHLSMSMRGPAVQVGIGANGKNGNMGMASWYVVTVLSDDDELLPDEFNTSVGDFNVDLGICDDLITPESFPCEDSFNVSHEDTTHNVMCSGNYTLRRTWTLKDCTGNPSNKSVDFDIFDDIKPVISGLPSNSDAPHRCNSTYTPPAGSCSDHCDPNPLLTGPLLIDTQHSCDGSFDRTYRWTCTDDCGNVKTEDRIIHFVDDDDPYFVNLPDGEEPYTEQYTCDEDFSDGKDRFTPGDVCSSVTSDYEESDPFDKTCEHNYTLTRTWTVTDDCNNEDDLVITVTITDPDPPSIFTGSPTCRPATLTEPQYVFEGANVNRETLDNPDHLFRATDLCSSRDEIDIIITGCYSDQDDFFDMDQSQRYIDTGGNFNDHCYYEEDSNGVGRLIIAPIADYDNDLGRMYYVTAHARDDCLLESEPITREILVPTSSLSFSLRNLPTTDECLYFTNCDEQCPHPCHYDVPLCKSVPVGDMPFSVISNGLTGNELSFDIQANGGFTGAMTRFTVDVDETVVEVTGQSPDVDIPALWKHLGAHAESYIGGVNWIATDGGAASVTVTGDYETTDVPAELAWDTADDEHLCAAFEVTALGARTDATTFQHISGKVGIVGTLINDPGDHAEIISPIAGAVVQLMQDGTPLRTVSTASDGSYTFRNVPAGSGYQVGVIKEGIFYEVELGIHRYVTGEARDHAAIWCYGEPKDVSPGSSANFGIFLDTAKWDRDRDRARYFEQYVTAAGQVRHSTTGRSKGTSTSFNGNSKPAGFWARQIALSDDGKAHLMSINDLVLKKAVAAAESVLTNSAGTFVCTGVRALLAGTNGHAKEVTSLLLNELTGYGVFQPYRGLQRIVLDLALNEDCSNPTAETKNMVKKMNRAD